MPLQSLLAALALALAVVAHIAPAGAQPASSDAARPTGTADADRPADRAADGAADREGERREAGVPFRIAVEAPDRLDTLLSTHLDIARFAERGDLLPSELDRAVAGVQEDARGLLATEGYFDPRVDVSLDRGASPPTVRVRVVPGPRTTVRTASVTIEGPILAGGGADPRRARDVVDTWELPPGAPFRQQAWVAAKNDLLRRLLTDRYPFARLVESRADVDPAATAADLVVRVDSGPLVRLGEVEVRGLQRYAESNVRNLRPFPQGEAYRQELMLEYQTALQTTGYFESSVVSIGPPPDDIATGHPEVYTAPVVVSVVEHPYQSVKLGVGFSTNTGARVSAEYAHNEVFGLNHRLESVVRLESLEQSASVTLLTPANDRQFTYRTHAQIDASDIQGLETQSASISFGRSRSGIQLDTSLYAQLIYERKIPSGGVETESTVAAINYSWTYRDVDSLLAPTRGYMVNLQGGGGVPVNGPSDSRFLRAYGRVAGFFPLGEHRAILRAEAGRVFAQSRVGIPEEYLFRAGGNNSVRGYAYQELGVKEQDATVGGRYLFTASAEYVHQILPDWGLAVFVDAGNAADSLSDLKPVFGYGVGARWRSPVGLVAVDVAYGEADNNVRLHFALGFTF